MCDVRLFICTLSLSICCVLPNIGLPMLKMHNFIFIVVTYKFVFEIYNLFWWIFYPGNRLMCTNKTCYVVMRPQHTKENEFIHANDNFFLKFLPADQTLIPGVRTRCFCRASSWIEFDFVFCYRKFSKLGSLFDWTFRTIYFRANSSSNCLSRECGTYIARFREDQTQNGHQNPKRNSPMSRWSSDWPVSSKRLNLKKTWTLTIEDFDLRFDEHFESHLLGNRLHA